MPQSSAKFDLNIDVSHKHPLDRRSRSVKGLAPLGPPARVEGGAQAGASRKQLDLDLFAASPTAPSTAPFKVHSTQWYMLRAPPGSVLIRRHSVISQPHPPLTHTRTTTNSSRTTFNSVMSETSTSNSSSAGASAPEAHSMAPNSPERGRGQGQGQGRGRGRGRGRGGRGGGFPGGGYTNATFIPMHYPMAAVRPAPIVQYRERAPRPHLTHFISIPIGHNEGLRNTVSAFTDALLKVTPAIPGLDASIVVPARRLHFTLGVMSLDIEPDASVRGPAGKGPRTLEAAKVLLREVRPKIMALLGEQTLRVSLDCLDIMKPENGDRARAHVMWVGPGEGDRLKKLEEVAKLVQDEFKTAGLLVDEDRPFKTHCTVLNTVYRKPALKWRFPFSYQSILASDAMKAIRVRKDAVDPSELERGRRVPISVDLGECGVDEIQICEMGSWGPEGEYVAVARESLTRA